MAASRTTLALVLAVVASTATAAESRGSFSVAVRVVAPLRARGAASSLPAGFVATSGGPALPCGPASSAACRAAAASAAVRTPGEAVILTSFTDGSPVAVIER